jgi:acetoin utilization deacetylase AcuC-like enzyme
MTRLYYTDHYEFPLPAGHRFPVRKYRMLREKLERDGLFEFAPAPLAPVEAIEMVHDPDYVRGFLDGTLPPGELRPIGLPWSPGLVARSLASVGGTLCAADDALRTGRGGTLAGGTHHAFRASGAGYCVFNDVDVAIAWLRAEGRIQRAAVIDLDVHQGDGTAAIFAGDRDVFTVSLHGRRNFPFRKQRSSVDVEFEDGAEDEEYLAGLAGALDLAREFAPDIVFYQAGVDGLKEDRLGRLALTMDGLARRDGMVFEAFGCPLTVTLGGGYADPIELTVEGAAQTYRLLASERLTASGSAEPARGRATTGAEASHDSRSS